VDEPILSPFVGTDCAGRTTVVSNGDFQHLKVSVNHTRAAVDECPVSNFHVGGVQRLQFANCVINPGSWQSPCHVSHKPSNRLPLLSARPTVTLATLKGLLPVTTGQLSLASLRGR